MKNLSITDLNKYRGDVLASNGRKMIMLSVHLDTSTNTYICEKHATKT